MNLDSYNKLPEPMQKLLMDTFIAAEAEIIKSPSPMKMTP
jgi:TRAP-type mannitol/chloroaromatic compound transport system substrate-binding protein